MAFWEYCFPECSLFVYYKSGGILEKLPPSKKEQNRQNQCIMIQRQQLWTDRDALVVHRARKVRFRADLIPTVSGSTAKEYQIDSAKSSDKKKKPSSSKTHGENDNASCSMTKGRTRSGTVPASASQDLMLESNNF